MIGEQLGRYIIEREVGQGGMSVVYRARDTVLDRDVAVKVLHPHLSNREESRRRFQREARAVARLSHPNITQVFDFSESGAERSYIVMEFLEGGTLRTWLDAHPLRHPEVAALLTVKLCEALQHAHAFGIIHRDIKPENVMICRDGVIKLTDFGIAQVADAQGMTVTGALVGSPAHMSPEMIEGHDLDARADLFSLGTVLYFAATGALPFNGRNAPMVLKAIAEGSYLDAEMVNPRVGRKLARIIDTCLALRPDDRYSTADDLRADLMAWLGELGLDNVDAELRAYFADREAYEDALRPRLLEALERLGAAALDERRIGAATEHFNRALALDPEHPRILRLIRRIDQRRKLLVYLAVAAALLLTTSAIVAISSLPADPDLPGADPERPTAADARPAVLEASLRRSGASERADEAASLARQQRQEQQATDDGRARAAETRAAAQRRALLPAEAPSSTTPPTRERDAGTAVAAAPPDAGAANLPDAPPDTPPEAQELRVALRIFPRSANVTLNNTRYTVEEVERGVRVKLLPGRRLVGRISHDSCYDTTLRPPIAPDQTEYEHVVRLLWKQAFIKVESNDPKATILVFDAQNNQPIRSAGAPNTPLGIPIIDTIDPLRLVRVSVLSEGRSRQYKDIRLEAGKTHVINATF